MPAYTVALIRLVLFIDCYILGFFDHIANISKMVFSNKLK